MGGFDVLCNSRDRRFGARAAAHVVALTLLAGCASASDEPAALEAATPAAPPLAAEPTAPERSTSEAPPDIDDVEAPSSSVAKVEMSAACALVGAEGETVSGVSVRCTDVWGQRAWRPIPDDVAREAYEQLTAWWASLPPAGREVLIERHPDVPAEFEEALRPVLDLARRAHASTNQRWIALLYPHNEEGIELAIQRALDNVRPSERAQLERDWAPGQRAAECGSNNEVGRNPDTGVGFIISTLSLTQKPNCLLDRPDQNAYQTVREYLMGPSNAGKDPCWAGEGRGWPLGRALIDVAGGTSWEDDWGFWAGQLMDGGWTANPSELGLRRSMDWTLDPSRGQYCYRGVGHVQGSLAHELLIAENGFDLWIRNWQRGAGIGAFGRSVDSIMDAADDRLRGIGVRID